MLHAMFRSNRTIGSGQKMFEGVLTIYGRGGLLRHVTQMPRANFRFPYPRRLHIKFGFDWPMVSEKNVFAHCRRRTDRRRTMGIL